jgi:hypothetical protein
VLISPTSDINISADSIWIRKGSLTTGNTSNPYTNTANIILTGQLTDRGYIIDSTLTGRKNLVVTGSLNLIGKTNLAHTAKLIMSTQVGDTSINVDNSTGWQVGDRLTLSTSSRNSN